MKKKETTKTTLEGIIESEGKECLDYIPTEKIRDIPIDPKTKRNEKYVEKILYRGVETKTIKVPPNPGLPIPAASEEPIDCLDDNYEFEYIEKEVPARDETTYVGDAIAMSNCKIAEAILVASSAVASALERYADIVENKNKLDEYYKLLEDIEQYENKLIDMKCLKDAYSNIKLQVRQPMEMIDKEICLIVKTTTEEGINKIISLVKSSSMNLMEAYYKVMTCDNEWTTGRLCGSSEYPIKFYGKYFEIELACTYKKHNLEIIDMAGACWQDELIESVSNDRYVYDVRKITGGEGFSETLIEKMYDRITEDDINMMIVEDKYQIILNVINSINQSIQLSNLRCLHSALRNEVRKRKIEKAILEE